MEVLGASFIFLCLISNISCTNFEEYKEIYDDYESTIFTTIFTTKKSALALSSTPRHATPRNATARHASTQRQTTPRFASTPISVNSLAPTHMSNWTNSTPSLFPTPTLVITASFTDSLTDKPTDTQSLAPTQTYTPSKTSSIPIIQPKPDAKTDNSKQNFQNVNVSSFQGVIACIYGCVHVHFLLLACICACMRFLLLACICACMHFSPQISTYLAQKFEFA